MGQNAMEYTRHCQCSALRNYYVTDEMGKTCKCPKEKFDGFKDLVSNCEILALFCVNFQPADSWGSK
jgi:hypothetical protein